MKAKALTNPTPEFVSQVIAGANQEPYRAVKMDGVDDIAALFATQELTMKDAVTKAKSSGHDIAQLVFKGGEFTDRAKVDAWLKEGGFEGYEVSEKAGKDEEPTEYTVTSTVLKFETGSIKKVKGQVDGLFVFVGKTEVGEVVEKTADEIAAEAAAATNDKGSTVVVKADDVVVTIETATVIEASKIVDGDKAKDEEIVATVAPVEIVAKADDVADTERRAKVDAAVGELRTKGIYDVSRIGSILSDLSWMVYDAEYSDLPDDAVAAIKSGANSLIDAMVSAGNQAIEALAQTFKSDTTKTDAVIVAKSETAETVVEPTVEAPATVLTSLDPALAEVLKGMGEAIASIATAVKAQGEALEEVKTTSAKAEAVLTEQGQSRKGADVTETVVPAVDTQKHDAEQGHAERRFRSAFGSYKGNGFSD
jgi:hypothetical protein